MAFWDKGNKFPYTNNHDANLDYMMTIFENIKNEWHNLYVDLVEWKGTTTLELNTWKTNALAQIEQYETDFRAEIAVWKATTEQDIGVWEQSVLADLGTWRANFETLFATTFSNLSQIKTDAEAARDAAALSADAALESAEEAESSAESVSSALTQIATNAADISDLKTQLDNTDKEIGFYASKQFSVTAGHTHSSNNDKLTIKLNAEEKIFIKIDTDGEDAISCNVVGFKDDSSFYTIMSVITNTGYQPFIPITLAYSVKEIGLYIAAQETDVNYKFYVKIENSYSDRITENKKKNLLLNQSVIESNEGVANFSLFSDFVNGTLSTGNVVQSYGRNRIVSTNIIHVIHATTVTVANGFRFAAHYFVNEEYSSDSQWITGTYTIPANSSFRCQISRATEISDEIADIPTFIKQVTFDTKIGKEIKNHADRLATYDGNQALKYNDFELGNITMNSLGWTYSNSTQRVRLKQSVDLYLDVGDIIRLKDYTKANMYIGVQVTESSYGAYGWLSSDYVAVYGGKHTILIKTVPEATQSSIDFLFDLLEIIRINDSTTGKLNNVLSNGFVNSVNHRGFNRTAPENTLPAYRLSKIHGFGYAECDVSFTSDNVPVLLHDTSINRTARNADGTEISETLYIYNLTFAQAREYDFGIWKGAQWAGTKIPSFEEFMILCQNIGLKPYVEIKEAGMTQANVWDLVAIAKKCGMLKHTTWISFSSNALSYVLEKDNSARIGLLVNSVTSEKITEATGLVNNYNDVFVNSGSHTNAEIELCKNADFALETWTINNENTIISLDPYITGVTSDLYAFDVVSYNNSI